MSTRPTRIVIELPPASDNEDEIRQLLESTQVLALFYRDRPGVKITVEDGDNSD
jgi:hypothetical protein